MIAIHEHVLFCELLQFCKLYALQLRSAFVTTLSQNTFMHAAKHPA